MASSNIWTFVQFTPHWKSFQEGNAPLEKEVAEKRAWFDAQVQLEDEYEELAEIGTDPDSGSTGQRTSGDIRNVYQMKTPSFHLSHLSPHSPKNCGNLAFEPFMEIFCVTFVGYPYWPSEI